jgi:hypothetical protein
VFLLVLEAATLPARGDDPTPSPARPALIADFETEYYVPQWQSRQITTVFANGLVGVDLLHGFVRTSAGLSGTAAWGSINQRGAVYTTRVGGVGPIFLLQVCPIRLGRFSLTLDGLGGIVFYSSDFPPGGSFYNFTWRLGGTLAVRLTDRLSLTAGARWMHVSNGQGLNPHNPAYQATGLLAGMLYTF